MKKKKEIEKELKRHIKLLEILKGQYQDLGIAWSIHRPLILEDISATKEIINTLEWVLEKEA